MKKGEMQKKFQQAMDKFFERLRNEKMNGNENQAWCIAWEICGAAQLAEKMGIIEYWDMMNLCDTARENARRGNPLDEPC